MRRSAAAGVWGLLFFLGTGCATIIREAVQRDMYENARNQPNNLHEANPAEKEVETPWVCPPDKIQVEDCRVTPCKVTCEEPKEPKRP
jgi:hypothetical protein